MLEELGLHYEVKNIEISKNVQKESWFLQINPNGRIPAIVDKTPAPNGHVREKRIFESGALMLYLCQRYDPKNELNYPYDTDEYWEVVEWLVWMQSGLGPMQASQKLLERPFWGSQPKKLTTVCTGPGEPFLPLRAREDRIRHKALPDGDPTALPGARRSAGGAAGQKRSSWQQRRPVDRRRPDDDCRHREFRVGQLGGLGGD